MGKIQFQNVNKVYPNGFHAIHDFNLDVDDGEFIVFVGPSGCGKSTVLRMLAGLEEITSGKLLLDGKVINNRPPVERDIAIVFQDYALYGNLSVYDNVGISMKVQHQKDTAIYDKVQQAAATVDIQQYLNRLPGQLSGGQKQRVALARSIIRHPKAFLMDEPLSNLDAKLRNSTRIEIVKLQRSLKVTTIYVTHDQTEAMTMADRMVVMKEGVVQQVGTPREIYGLPVNMFVAGFIGSPQINFIRGKLEGETFVCGENRLRLAPWAAHKLEAWSSKEVILGLHPEVFSLAEEAGDGTFKADFVAKEFMGSHLIIHAQIQQQDVQCHRPALAAGCISSRICPGRISSMPKRAKRSYIWKQVTTMRELKENIHIQTVAKLLIAVAAIAHLIFTYVHTSALLLLENQICGFIMFLFVLLGLVTLFESTQVHVSRSFAGYATIALCAATVGMGADLVSIYQTAIRTQNSLEPAMVYKAVWFSLALMAMFALSGVLLLIDTCRKHTER